MRWKSRKSGCLAFTSRYCAIIGVAFAAPAARAPRLSEGDDNFGSLACDSVPEGEACGQARAGGKSWVKLIPGCVAGGIAPNTVNRLIVAGAGAGALVVVLALSVAFSGGVGSAFAALAGAGMDFGVGIGAGVGISAAIGAGSVIIIGKLYMSSLGLKGLFYLIFLPAMLGLLAAGSSNPGWRYLENEIAQSAAILAWLLFWLMPHEGRGLLWLCERVAEWLGAPIQPPKGSTTCYHRPWRGAPWQKSIAP